MSTLTFVTVLSYLLEQTSGLAGTIYGATLSAETCQQDVSQSLHVLTEPLRTTLAHSAANEA